MKTIIVIEECYGLAVTLDRVNEIERAGGVVISICYRGRASATDPHPHTSHFTVFARMQQPAVEKP